MNLTQLFDLSLTGRRDTTALEWRGGAFTFGELDARSNRLAHLLARRGLRLGDRLALEPVDPSSRWRPRLPHLRFPAKPGADLPQHV